MPNKYSHAFVLSNYDRRGLIDFNQPHFSQPPPFKPSRLSARFDDTTLYPSKSVHVSSRPSLKGRLRIEDPSSPPSKASPPPLRRRGSSIETQIYAPARSPTPASRHELQGSPVRIADTYIESQSPTNLNGTHRDTAYAQPGRSHPPSVARNSDVYTSSQAPSQASTAHMSDAYVQPQILSRPSTAHSNSQSTTEDIYDLYSSHSPAPQTDWTHSSAVKILRRASWAPRPLSSNGPRPGSRRDLSGSHENDSTINRQLPRSGSDLYEDPWIEAQTSFAPTRPLSPPATPESQRSFSIGTIHERPEKEKPDSPPPLPERSARRTPPRSSSREASANLPFLRIAPDIEGSDGSSSIHSPALSTTTKSPDVFATSQVYQHHPEPLRPRASSAIRSPTLSTTTRRSSMDSSSRSLNSQSLLSHQWRKPSSVFHSPNISINTRTSSLKAATSPPDFREKHAIPSKVFTEDNDADLESLPSTLDFDITPWPAELDASLTTLSQKQPNANVAVPRPISIRSSRASSFDSVAPPPIRLRGSIFPTNTEKPLPKTPKKTISSMLFSRIATKTIPYSQTKAGTPPVPVSTSRIAVSSISAPMPDYRGRYSARQNAEVDSSRRTRESNLSGQTRGQSVPPKSTSDRRRSWFRTSQVDKVLGRDQRVIEKNIREILRANEARMLNEDTRPISRDEYT